MARLTSKQNSSGAATAEVPVRKGPPRKRNRLAKRQNELTALLRKRIIDNTYPPGCRLPIQVDLLKEFNVSNITLQRAIDTLCREGFIEARRRTGTFVVDHPPHLAHYALIIPGGSNTSINSHFYQNIAAEALLRNERLPGHLDLYYASDESLYHPDFRRLCEMVTRHLYAGLIFASSPHKFEKTPILNEPGIPRAVVASRAVYAIPVMYPNPNQCDLGLATLAAKGARNIAVVTFSCEAYPYSLFEGKVAQFGLRSHPDWYGSFTHLQPPGLRSFIRILLSNPKERPIDGIFILDDHLTEIVMEAIASLGPEVVERIHIVTTGNFPLHQQPTLPATVIGVHAKDILDTAIELIDAQRRGDQVAQENHLPIHLCHTGAGAGRVP